LRCIETLLFLSRDTGFQKGVVADDIQVNATSVHKAITKCHFFVKNVKAVSKPHKYGLFAPFGLELPHSHLGFLDV
jgi:hypothetical protein